jgi:plasmid replication initiation protein
MKEKRMMVSKSVALTQANQNGMGLTEYRIFLYALAKINPLDVEKAKGELYISLRDFRDMFPTKDRGYKNIHRAIEAGENRFIVLQTGEALKVWETITLEGDYIRVQFSEDIIPHITDLKGGYVKYPLEEIRWYTSLPAIRLYEALTQWAKKGEKVYPVAQLQGIMGVHYKSARLFYKTCLRKACKAISEQGRFSIDLQRLYNGKGVFSAVLVHMAKNDLPLVPTAKAQAWANGEYTSERKKRQEKVDFFLSASANRKKEETPVPTLSGAVASLTFKIGSWLDETVVKPVADTVKKIANALPDIVPEPTMAVAMPAPTPAPAPEPIPAPMSTVQAKTETTAPTMSDIPAYVPDTYRKNLTAKEIAKVLNVFDIRGVFEYLRGDILKQAWGIFCASKDEVKAPANYLAGVVRNLLTKIGVDMPNIFAPAETTPTGTGKYPRKIEWVENPVARKKGFLDWEANFDVDLFDYDAPDTCCTEAERIRYSKEAKRRSKVSVADMVTQIPLDLYWRLTDEQVDKICDYYENAGVSLEAMKTELFGAYQTINVKNVQSSAMGSDAVFCKLWETIQTHPVPQTLEKEDLRKWYEKY